MNRTASNFQETQQAFCHWLRDPQSDMPSGLDQERMQLYRGLLFNNICSFIDLVYPVTRSILPEQQWQCLLEEFFSKSQNQSPFYHDISLQFREYLTAQQHPILQEYPWLAELLQFEWLELYLDTVELEEKTIQHSTAWQLNTQVWTLVYQYPVYLWTTAAQQFEHAPSVVMVWRNQNDQVCVAQLSPLFALLVERLNQSPMSQHELHALLQSTMPALTSDEIANQLDELATQLTQRQLLYHPSE